MKKKKLKKWASIWKAAAKFWQETAETDYALARHSEEPDIHFVSYEYKIQRKSGGWDVIDADDDRTMVYCNFGDHYPDKFWIDLGKSAPCPTCGRVIACDGNRTLTEVVLPGGFSQRWIVNQRVTEIGCHCLSTFYPTHKKTINQEQSFTCPVCQSIYDLIDGRVYRNGLLANGIGVEK